MRASVLVVATVLFSGGVALGDKPQGHPHFNDGGTLRWYTKLADAEEAAKKEGKFVFIEYGREA